MTRPHLAEVDLGRVVVAHLEALGAEVYQEVDVAGGVADIVAKVNAEIWIIELRTSLSLALICQAMERRRLAHRVFIAAPSSRNMRDVALLCGELGIGLWRVYRGTGSEWDPDSVREEAPARRWNSRPVKLATKLREQHKTAAMAGTASGAGRWTPYRDTCDQLASVVRSRPGITLKHALVQMRHHYSSMASAKSSLATWIRAGKVPGVSIRDGALYPPEAA